MQVVERESTATFAVSDPRLRDALAYLHQHIEKPITIDQITEHAGVSRRWLEYAFRDVLGETPYQYLRRQRLALARRLLAEEPALEGVQRGPAGGVFVGQATGDRLSAGFRDEPTRVSAQHAELNCPRKRETPWGGRFRGVADGAAWRRTLLAARDCVAPPASCWRLKCP